MREIQCVNLGENVSKLTMGLALVWNDLQKCSMDVIFEQGPQYQNISNDFNISCNPTDTEVRLDTLRSGLRAAQRMVVVAFLCRKPITTRIPWGLAHNYTLLYFKCSRSFTYLFHTKQYPEHRPRWRSGYVSTNGLVGTGFASRYRLQTRADF